MFWTSFHIFSLFSLILPSSSLYCSPLIPSHYSSHGQTTHVSISIKPGSSLCLSTNGGHMIVLTILSAHVVYHVRDQYKYSWPQLHVSCYCTCHPSQCKLPTCPLCYNLTSTSPPCGPDMTSHSTTCCSVKLTTPNPTMTAVFITSSSVKVTYKLEIVSPSGQVETSALRHVHIGSSPTTIQHVSELSEILLSIDKVVRDSDKKLQNQWYTANKENQVSPAKINDLHDVDTSLPGWLQVINGVVKEPRSHLIASGIHVTTLDCQNQQFSADTNSINLHSGVQDDGDSELVWDGQTVTSKTSDQTVSVNMVIQSDGGSLEIFANKTILANWTAEISVLRSGSILNITTHNSHGLMMGSIENILFSFFLPSAITTSFISTSLPILVSHLTTAHVCLGVICQNIERKCQESCKTVPIKHIHSKTYRHWSHENNIDVQSIPVIWHQDEKLGLR